MADPLLERYAVGTDAVLAALDAVGDRALDRRLGGGWSPREVIHHLADSETRSYLRLRQLLVGDNPVIETYDEQRWAGALHYSRPIEASLAVVAAVRAASLELLRLLGPLDWEQAGSHPEHAEPYTVQTWLSTYADHPHDHAAQIRAAAGAEAEPMLSR